MGWKYVVDGGIILCNMLAQVKKLIYKHLNFYGSCFKYNTVCGQRFGMLDGLQAVFNNLTMSTAMLGVKLADCAYSCTLKGGKGAPPFQEIAGDDCVQLITSDIDSQRVVLFQDCLELVGESRSFSNGVTAFLGKNLEFTCLWIFWSPGAEFLTVSYENIQDKTTIIPIIFCTGAFECLAVLRCKFWCDNKYYKAIIFHQKINNSPFTLLNSNSNLLPRVALLKFSNSFCEGIRVLE